MPLSVAEKASEVGRIATELKPITNPRMESDLTTSLALAKAAVEGALANVKINLDSFGKDSAEDAAFVADARQRVAAIEAHG